MHRHNTARPARSFRSARLAAIGGVAVAALALAGCSGDGGGGASPSGAPDENAVLTVGLVLEPKSLDIRTVSGAPLEQVLIDNQRDIRYIGLCYRHWREGISHA